MVVMTTLFWTLTWLPQVLSAISQPPQPVNLTLHSINLRHMLEWRPGPETPAGVHYNVTINTESGRSWVSVSGCQRVRHPLVCNLTGSFPDLRQDYLVQVTAWLGGQASQPLDHPLRFKPIKDTHLDLPRLTVTPCGGGLCVDLQPPTEPLKQAYDTLDYKLKVTSDSADGVQFIRSPKEWKWNITDLAPGRKYCVSVCLLDSLESKESNYSQPVCVFTTGIFNADPWISAMLCLLVLMGLAVFGLLVVTGFCCLGERPLPLVLTSVHHANGLLVMAHSTTPLSSLLDVKATLPSAGERKNSRSSSEDSEEEGGTESTGDSRPAYKTGALSGLLSSSSLSSSSLSNCLSPTSDTTSDLLSSLQPEVPVPTETRPGAGLDHTPDTHTDTHSVTAGTVQTSREEAEGVDSQDVNLLTLTFGSHEKEKEKEEEEEEHVGVAESGRPSVSEDVGIARVQPSQTWNHTDFAMETTSADKDEEDEDEDVDVDVDVDEDEDEDESGYMGRPCTDTLKKLLR